MSINAQSTLNQLQNNTTMVNYQNGQKNLGTGKMTREGFMQLILAQLQYQDPTNPQDSTQMLSQQLQLEQADQMKDIVNATKFSQASSMVGKEVTLPDARWDFKNSITGTPEWDYTTNQAKSVTGVIDSVQFDPSHGKALIKVNGNYYDADKIQQLSVPQQAGGTAATTGSGA